MDWQTILEIIVPLGAFMAWIYNRLDKRFDKMENRIDKMESRFDGELKEVRSEIREVRTSLNRMEGAFYSKDCCMLKNDEQKKAE